MSERSTLRVEVLEDRLAPSVANFFAIAAGEGGGPRVQVFNATNGFLVADFAPFEPTFNGGVTVAMANVNGDFAPELIVGAGPGGGPRVRIFDGAAVISGFGFDPNAAQNVIADFFAFEESQRGGVFVSAGDFSGIGLFDDVIIGAGPGGGPRVRILDGERITLLDQSFTGLQTGDVIADFFAFESTFRNGVTVAGTPSQAGILSDLVVAPGFGGSPRVRVLSGVAITNQRTFFTSFQLGDTIADFFAYNPAFRSGAFVAAADLNADGFSEIITGPGMGVPPIVNVFAGNQVFTQRATFTGGLVGDLFDQFSATNQLNYTNGVTVGSAINPFGGDFLLHGFGGQGIVGQAVATNYLFTSGVAIRNPLFTFTLDPAFVGRVNVSN